MGGDDSCDEDARQRGELGRRRNDRANESRGQHDAGDHEPYRPRTGVEDGAEDAETLERETPAARNHTVAADPGFP